MSRILFVVGGFVGAFAMFVLIAMLLIKLGWAMFMVPVFNMPNLTLSQALGFSLLAASFRSNIQSYNKGE